MRRLAFAILVSLPCLAEPVGQRVIMRQGFPFVDVAINGQGPFRMLVDTGADISSLTPRAARRAGLEFDHRVLLTTMAGETVVPGGSENVIQLGGTTASGVAILAMDLPHVQSLAPEADGVLGQSFLSRTAYLLDFGERRLWLGADATARASRLPNEATATRSGVRTLLSVSLEAGGRTWYLALDSGTTSLVVNCNPRCPRAWGIERDGQLMTHAGDRAVLRGTLRQVQLGDFPVAATEAVLLDPASNRTGDDGLLPARWFSAFYVDGTTVRFAPARF